MTQSITEVITDASFIDHSGVVHYSITGIKN